jgi:hypothetical protein
MQQLLYHFDNYNPRKSIINDCAKWPYKCEEVPNGTLISTLQSWRINIGEHVVIYHIGDVATWL